jgi:hypothetical protein
VDVGAAVDAGVGIWGAVVVTANGSSCAIAIGNCAVIMARNTKAAIRAHLSIRFMLHPSANPKHRQF